MTDTTKKAMSHEVNVPEGFSAGECYGSRKSHQALFWCGSQIVVPKGARGWYVVQLDSGHFMATDGNEETVITVSLKDARRWAKEKNSGSTD